MVAQLITVLHDMLYLVVERKVLVDSWFCCGRLGSSDGADGINARKDGGRGRSGGGGGGRG